MNHKILWKRCYCVQDIIYATKITIYNILLKWMLEIYIFEQHSFIHQFFLTYSFCLDLSCPKYVLIHSSSSTSRISSPIRNPSIIHFYTF